MNNILIINSYAGSLVLGAMATGVPILASMEDSGYGIAAQKKNFPDLKYVDRLPWPTEDLTNTMVIAHPPCSAFSNMNIIADKKGMDTSAFECHRRVMEYSFKNNCEALAIESVPGALPVAGDTYRSIAAQAGYDCCFILLNAVGFGVPQWRPRFWALFFRRDLGLPFFKFKYHPHYRNIQSILTTEPVPEDPVTKKHSDYLRKRTNKVGFDLDALLASETIGGFDSVAKTFLNEKDGDKIKELTGTKGCYRAGLPRKLDPTLWAPVILGFSLWYVDTRPLNRIEYQRIMGFPDDFKWSEKEGKDYLTYLSKGVCPPVATWIIEQVGWNLRKDMSAAFTHSCGSGEVVDLQPRKQDVIPLIRQGDYQGYNETMLNQVPVKAYVVPDRYKKAPVVEPVSQPDGYSSLEPPTGPIPNMIDFGLSTKDQIDVDDAVTYQRAAETRAALPGERYTARFSHKPAHSDIFMWDDEEGIFRLQARLKAIVEVDNSPRVEAPREPQSPSMVHQPPVVSPQKALKKALFYGLVAGVDPEYWGVGSHAYAVAKALQLAGEVQTLQQITDSVIKNSLIETTMSIPKAVSWILTQMVKKGKVIASEL